jgi:hypothetical protein
MQQLWTFLAPVVQLFFYFILTIVWVAGFVRQKNPGFLFLALATFAAAALNVIRQAVVNGVVYYSGNVSAVQRSTTLGLIMWVALIISIVLWLMMIIGALLVVFQRSKLPDTQVPPPPPSGDRLSG